MRSGSRLHMPAIGVFVVVMSIAFGAAPPRAQTIANPNQKSAATAKPATATAAKATPKRPPAPAATEQGTDYWAINNNDLGRYSREIPAERQAFERKPLKTADGTVGFTSEAVKGAKFADGRPVPGLEKYGQDPQSYVGLSLSLTSTNKGFPLVPAPNFPSSSW